MNDEITLIDKRSQQERVKDFSELLNKIKEVDDKKKQLWKEIYENAIADRQNAFTMFVKLVTMSEDKSHEHAVHGRNMATYLERMSKANDQLIKLAELVMRSDVKDAPIEANDMFDRISKNK